MAINFPGSLDNFTNPTSASPINSPSHADQHANANDAIEALEAKVGVDGSSVVTSHDYKIAQLQSLVTSAVAGAKSIYQDVRNQSGSAFTKATPVYVSGSTGASGQLLVSAASNATEATSSKTMGITTSAISNNSNGQVISEGILEGIDTTGAADGDPVWLGVNGAKIYGLANKPSAPAHLVFLGIVIRGGQANTGSMYVKIQNGFELHELHNVQVSSLVNGNILAYDSTAQTWKNTNTLQSTSSTVPLIIKGVTSQSANLQEWQNSSGDVLAKIDNYGNLTLNTAANVINAAVAGYTPLTIKGAASQTANLQQWQNSAGTVLASVSATGTVYAYETANNNALDIYQGSGARRLVFGTGGLATNSIFSSGLLSWLGIAQVEINSSVSSRVGLLVKGVASQYANLQEWQNSAGTILAKVDANGSITVGTNLIVGNASMFYTGGNYYNSTLSIATQGAGYSGIVIRGQVSQSADLQQWQDSSGTVLARIDANGRIISNLEIKGISFQTNNNYAQIGEYNSGTYFSWKSATASVNSGYGSGYAQFFVVPGTTAGTLKFIVRGGASGGETTILDNIDQTNGIANSYLITAPSSSTVGLIIKGAASQTSDLQQWQNSSGNIKSKIISDGSIIVGGGAWTKIDSTYGQVAVRTDGVLLGSLTVGTGVGNVIGLVVKGATSQTANLQEWQDSSGSVITKIGPNGGIDSTIQITGRSAVTAGTGNYLSASLNVIPLNASIIGAVIRGYSSQTADLQQWQNSSGTVLTSIFPSGNISIGTTQAGVHGQANSQGVVTTETAPLIVRGSAPGQNMIELWAYGKDAYITGAVGNGTSVTYTTSIAHGFTTSDWVAVGGIVGTGGSGTLNIYGGGSPTAVTTYTFTMTNSSTATYVSGGYARNAQYPGNILQAYRSDGMSLFTIGSSGGFAMADVMSVANVGYQQAGISVQPNLPSSAAIRMYGRSAQTAEILDVRNYIYKSGGSDSIFAIIPDYSVSANADGYGAWVRIRNSATPTANPTSAGYLYVNNGALNYMGTSGLPQQIIGADGTVKFTAVNTTSQVLIVKGIASQSGDLQQWQQSDGTVTSYVAGDGTVYITNNRALFVNSGYIGSASLVTKAAGPTWSGLIVKGAASQTANLQEWQNSVGTAISYIDKDGQATLTGGYISRLYTGGGISGGTIGYLNASTFSASIVPIVTRGAASQTADLQQWQNSSGTVLAKVDASGTITSSAKTLYLDGGSLQFGYGGGASSGNLAMGTNALANNTTGNVNVAIGSYASQLNTTGSYNISIGTGAGYANTVGWGNTAIGATSLNVNTASDNTALAILALASNTTGLGNTGLGSNALLNNTTGHYNIGIGRLSGTSFTTGNYNTVIGSMAFYNATSTGSNNTGIGYGVGGTNTGSNNVFIGYLAGSQETGSNKLYIANSNTSTPLIGGDFSTNALTISGNVNINSQSASTAPLIIKHAASPSSSYFEIRNSAGNPIWGINSAGEALTRTTTKYGANIQNDSSNNYNALYIQGDGGGNGIPLYVKLWSGTKDIVKFDNGGVVKLSITSDGSLKGGNSNTVSINTASTVDTVALSSFTSMEYTLSIKQGSKIRSSKVLVHTDGTSVDSTEYGIMEMGGGISGILVTASVSGTDAILQVTITDAATTNATVKLIKTML